MIRTIATLTALTAAFTVSLTAPASAAPAPAPVGPECQPGLVAAVLARLDELNVPLTPGQKIQYLEIYRAPSGTVSIRPCVVTVPSD